MIFFSYQRDKYQFDPSTARFGRIAYPCDSAPPLSAFQATSGLATAQEVETARANYGKNHFDIPVPTFGELFAEHAVAPFFVFQVFCAGLWCMDEYWCVLDPSFLRFPRGADLVNAHRYYSLFTLFMLIVFECTTVFQVRSSSPCSPPMPGCALLTPPTHTAPPHCQRVPQHVDQAVRHHDAPRKQVDRGSDG